MSPATASKSSSPHASSAGRGWAAWLLAALVTFGFPTLFSGGTCTWNSDDCDDNDFDDDDFDDCDWDDDNDSPSGAVLKPDVDDPYRLVKFERVESQVPGAHPVAWLRQIEGINLFHPDGPVSYQEADFEMFTGLVLQANKDFLSLPAWAGLLTFDGVEFERVAPSAHSPAAQAGQRVRWRQEAQQPDGSWQLVPDSEVVFYFDAVGNLVAVKNHTFVQVGQR